MYKLTVDPLYGGLGEEGAFPPLFVLDSFRRRHPSVALAAAVSARRT